MARCLVHRDHAELPAGLHQRVDLVDLPLPDEVADRRRRDEHLGRDRAARAVGGRQQLLGADPLQRCGELHADLLLLVRGEHVDDAVDRLRRVLGVQRREHEVAGLGRGERGRDRLEVTHLTDEDDVGVLAQDVAQRLGERVRVLPDLALVHDRALVRVQELDRVLDRHDVERLVAVHDVDERGERRALARTGRAGHEDEAARQVGELLAPTSGRPRWSKATISYGMARMTAPTVSRCRNTFIRNRLLPGQRVRAVELEVVLEPLPLLLREDRVDHLPDVASR